MVGLEYGLDWKGCMSGSELRWQKVMRERLVVVKGMEFKNAFGSMKNGR